MMTMKEVQKKLRKNNRKNYTLYAFCNFISLMLITAYSAMMLSPTVLNVLPEGGDSRKQMTAIFVLACVGSVVFTIYAAGLFFRKKSKEIGTLMALGASKKRLKPGVISETVIISGTSAFFGTAAGLPFAWLIWQAFRIFVVDTEEMKLTFDLKCFGISATFMILVIGAAIVLGIRYMGKTNIMDVIHEEHKNEPIRSVGKRCGIYGIILLAIGGVAGFFGGNVYQGIFHAYPPVWLNLLYVPLFIGLYMILLHTIVNGWRKRKNQYKGIISRSMMKFQGKQTVNNMLVVTVLIAGACFGMFYLPMIGAVQILENSARPYDYVFYTPADNDYTSRENIEKKVEEEGVDISTYKDADCSVLGADGETQVTDKGNSYHYEYREFLTEVRIITESSYSEITGEKIDIAEGRYMAVSSDEGTDLYLNMDITLLTNMTTKEQLKVEYDGMLKYNLLYGSKGYYVIDDQDYAEITKGAAGQWREKISCFNIKSGDSYQFARELFQGLIRSMDDGPAVPTFYDRIAKYDANQKGEVYWGDTDERTKLSFDKPDSTEFRQFWSFMPRIRIMDQNDFMKNLAVFMMMFLFIAIICMLSALVICYTRCMTIAINNQYVFDDLKRLGASPKFLNKELRSQAAKVFTVPAIVGMTMMYLLYIMIMFGNDNGFSMNEIVGLGMSLGVLAIFAGVIYGVYRMTISKMRKQLDITKG